MCRLNKFNIVVGDEVTLPNCTNVSWTADNIASKDIKLALLKVNLIAHDLGFMCQLSKAKDENQ